ncbi:cytochrome P450 [Trametes elegans]|nr:cytochrome P450 [Trametes elegans]
MNISAAQCALAGVIIAVLYARWRSTSAWRERSRGLPLPPGPIGWPVVGNLLDFPRIKPWRGLRDLCGKYGNIVYMNVMGDHIVVIRSAEVAHEFLNKRSANTSDRSTNPLFELSGQDLNPATMPYGEWWRKHRRAVWQYVNPGVAASYLAIQCSGARRFLAHVLASPSRPLEHVAFASQAPALKIVYDIDVKSADDDHLRVSTEALEALTLCTPGHFAVEFLPFLRHFPAWVPGAGFQKLFARCKAASVRLKRELFLEVKEAMYRGEDRQGVAADLLNRAHADDGSTLLTEEEEEIMMNVCAITTEASADTTSYLTEAFCLAMALHPEVQKRAHAELDEVVGPDRLPDHNDSDALVYISAIVKETLRWHQVGPLVFSHRTAEDDYLDGYFIPAGTTIVPNVWEMMHDPETYDCPSEFRPERFIKDGKLDPTVRDPVAFIFGFGRRRVLLGPSATICPGRYLALQSLFINIASLLHVFDISLPLDERGQPIPIEHEHAHGLLSRVEDARCTIRPRSACAEALILEAQHTTETAEAPEEAR